MHLSIYESADMPISMIKHTYHRCRYIHTRVCVFVYFEVYDLSLTKLDRNF